jgi:putative ABC transport system permease protein
MIFYVGVGMGFAVGVIVCYQILYTNIHDSMSELATLKAMGYRNSYFLGFVVRQSFFLSIAGFLPALIVSRYLFFEIEQRAGLPMLMDGPRVAWIYGLTLAMCVTSGLLAVRRLWNADPASLF